MDRRNCINAPDNFCYICGEFTPESKRKPITQNMKMAHFSCFKVKVGDHDKHWAPRIACSVCVNNLNTWFRGKHQSRIKFAIPMIWREQRDHSTDCYFCLTSIKGHSMKCK